MRTISSVCLCLLSLTFLACADDDENTTTMNEDASVVEEDMTQSMTDASVAEDGAPMEEDDMGMAMEDMAVRPMPEGEGELWHVQVALNEFGVEVPFQLELKRGENGFDFARIRATKDGMVSEPMAPSSLNLTK